MPILRNALIASLLLVPIAGSPPAVESQELCGTWELIDGFDLGDSTSLIDVTVVDPNDVWAVGSYRQPGVFEDLPLSAHWDGATWEMVPVPCPAHPLDVDCDLGGVSAVAHDDVWAVGAFTHPDEFDQEPFIVHWDGQAWSWVPAPTQPNGSGARLHDVRAVAADDVWAVGSWPGQPAGGQQEPLAMHWDGSSWQTFFVPYGGKLSFERTSLHRLAIVSSDDIWAIGNRNTALFPHTPFIVRWDGTSWSQMDPAPEPLYTSVIDIAVLGSDDVWISGTKYNEQDIFRPFKVLLHFDGSSWSELPDPGDPAVGSSQLAEVSADEIWATANTELSLWDGQAWSQAAGSPDPSLEVPLVLNFEPVAGCEAWAVGQHAGGNYFLHLSPSAVPQQALLESLVIQRGLLLGGDLQSLSAADDDRLQIDADGLGSRFVTQTIVEATSPVAEPSRLDLRVELAAGTAGVRGRLSLWNWDTGGWARISNLNVPETDGQTEVLAIPDPDRFVATDGAMRVLLQTLGRSTQVPDGYVLSVDLVELELTP